MRGRQGHRVRRMLAALAVVVGCLVAGIAPNAAQAYVHGCFVTSGEYMPVPPEIPDADYPGPLVVGDCYFRFFPGDTYSGAGSFSISCTSVGPFIFHGDTDVPVVDALLDCPRGAFPLVRANLGGTVTAGSPIIPDILRASLLPAH